MTTAFEHKVTEIVETAGRQVRTDRTFSGDGGDSRSVDVPDSSTDKLVTIAIDVSKIQSITILSTKALVLETNSGSEPGNTINLKAGVPYHWDTDSYFTNQLTVDVTAMYFTNTSGSAAVVDIEVVLDSTP